MRVISMVPSWTETLLTAGIEVVGRTRFCLYPEDALVSIPIVGGTKDWDWEAVSATRPDLILLDREENVASMAEQAERASIPCHATHVETVGDMAPTLRALSESLDNRALLDMAARWQRVAERQRPHWQGKDALPGLIDWGRRPDGPIDQCLYIIWRNPWMAVGRDTFVGSMLETLGLLVPHFETKYPMLDFADFDPARTLLLFASEPYPFVKKRSGLEALGFPYAFVDGEALSWYGIRSLRFLEAAL